MKAAVRWIATLGWLLLVIGAALLDAIREAKLKRKLGANYEGPLED